jgi:hypothetical protein
VRDFDQVGAGDAARQREQLVPARPGRRRDRRSRGVRPSAGASRSGELVRARSAGGGLLGTGVSVTEVFEVALGPMEQRGPMATDADVRRFEQQLGTELPDDYHALRRRS